MTNPSLKMLQIIAEGLRELNQDIVFVGGATSGFYVTNPGAPEPRPTMDIDCIIELTTYSKLGPLEKRLSAIGFEHDVSEGAPICRWTYRNVKVDIMPTDPAVMGFSNQWYSDGIRFAVERELPNKKRIRVFTAPYFIASKIAAYESRGKGDARTSPDFEDLIYVLDNRNEIVDELSRSKDDLQKYVRRFLAELLKSPDASESIAAALPYGSGRAGSERIRSIINKIVTDRN